MRYPVAKIQLIIECLCEKFKRKVWVINIDSDVIKE